MYLQPEEINTHLYLYQVQEISENNDTIVAMSIKVAIEKVKFYFSTNKVVLYDVAAIFEKTEDQRDPLILSLVKDIAVYEFITLCNADLVYERIKNKHDEALKFLSLISASNTPLDGLPVLPPSAITPNENIYIKTNTKFNHR